MKTYAPFNLIVHYPKTKEGWQELNKRVAAVHADAVINSVMNLKCPKEQKEQLLKAILKDAKEKLKVPS